MPPSDFTSGQLALGAVFADRYVVRGLLGAGGMGEVYEAEQTSLGRVVALKVLHADLSVQEVARARFDREARSAVALDHPGAVKVIDYGEFSGRLYLVMERLRGSTLRDELGDGLLANDLESRLEIIASVADVLEAAHDIGLVHRDIKPENIFLVPGVSDAPRVVVADFGLAILLDRYSDTRITEAGMIVGTPAYFSPEQARGVEVTPASDVYNLGAVLYELVAGDAPFSGNVIQLLMAHAMEYPQSLAERCPNRSIPAALDALALAMLEKDPGDRPTATAVAGACRELIRTRGGSLGRASQRLLQRARSEGAYSRLRTVPERAQATVATSLGSVGVVGQLDHDTVDALRLQGWDVHLLDERPPSSVLITLDVLLATSVTRKVLKTLTSWGPPVVATTSPDDMTALTDLVRVGVAAAVVEPIDAARLNRQLRRFARPTQGTKP